MALPRTAEIIIIGGGVMGASTAYHLASRGQNKILLLEKEEFFGLGATGRCAGGVRYQFSTGINIELSKKSLPMFEDFKNEIGQDINFQKCGYLFALTQPQVVDFFRHNVLLQQQLGVQTEWLTGDDVRSRLPLMRFDDALAGTFNPNEGLVDPNSVVMGYINAAQRFGARLESNVEVNGILVENGAVRGVRTNQGDISTPVVVNACGPWSSLIGDMAGIKIPITPIRRQMLTTSCLPEIPKDFPFVIDFCKSLYFHREGDGLLAGMSNQEEKPGYNQNVDEKFELTILDEAIARLPLLEHAGLATHWAGLYEVTPDAHPIYGTTPIAGFLVVSGFSGHGFMHGPVSGKLMSELILDGRFLTLDVSQLDLARFEEDRLIKEYNVV
jgi:sarcosine oxidase subunit beta